MANSRLWRSAASLNIEGDGGRVNTTVQSARVPAPVCAHALQGGIALRWAGRGAREGRVGGSGDFGRDAPVDNMAVWDRPSLA
jgi:hypothetical protein